MTCPICGTETDPKYRPFCRAAAPMSTWRKWLGGGYAIPPTAPRTPKKCSMRWKRHSPKRM
ncbi:MAG: DNA gyrase inhibitor YacG [Paracoccaceae bacterium]